MGYLGRCVRSLGRVCHCYQGARGADPVESGVVGEGQVALVCHRSCPLLVVVDRSLSGRRVCVGGVSVSDDDPSFT